MKRKLLISILILIAHFSITIGQTGKKALNQKEAVQEKTPKAKSSTQKKVPLIYDINGRKISLEEATRQLQENDFLPKDIYKNGKVAGFQIIKNESLGNPAPNFLVTTLDNKEVSLLGQKGKTTVLNFWFISCKPCLVEMPVLNKIADKYRVSNDIDLIAVNYGDGTASVRSFLEKNSFSFQIIADSVKIIEDFKIHSYPQTIVIDKNGKIVFWRIILGKDAKSLNKLLENELEK